MATKLSRYSLLAVLVAVVVAIVATITVLTKQRIAANERAWFVERLESLIPTKLRNNDLYMDACVVNEPEQLGARDTFIYRARLDSTPTGAILHAVAPDGYGGPIELLIAVDYQGALLGVDILRHNETQGIGDGFERHRSHWLDRLIGRSLSNTPSRRWTIRKDGGDFDEFTSASITPRAILKATRRALEYYASHRETVFNAPAYISQ